MTANTLDRRGLDETDAHLNQLSEVQYGTKLFSWQVGQKSQEDQMVSGEREKSQEYQMVSSESFTQSKKRCSKLVNQKIEKQLTKDDTNRKVLKCKKCSFTTSATLKKAKKQIKLHESKHNEEEKDLQKTEGEHTSDVVGTTLGQVLADVDPEVVEEDTTPEQVHIADKNRC